MTFKIEVKKCTHLCFQSVVGQFTPSVWWRLVSMHTTNRENLLSHNFCSFMSSLCACPASTASIERIFQCGLVWSNIRNRLSAETAEKLVKIYWFYRAEKI